MNPFPPDLPIPRHRAGIGLRAEHCVEFTRTRPRVGFIEVHSENYFGRGGKLLHYLELARRDHPLSLHGVGLSLGSTDPLNQAHLQRLRELISRLQPALVSEHLCWSSVGGVHANDLLPILVENVSSYVEFADSAMPEAEFVAEVARRSGCGLLLDVNNVHVSAHNHGFDAQAYLDTIPIAAVQEIHLAGFVARDVDGERILIDTHSAPVADAVWALFRRALQRFGAVPTLIEWDADLPPLAGLLAEAHKADALLGTIKREQRDDCPV